MMMIITRMLWCVVGMESGESGECREILHNILFMHDEQKLN